MIHETLSPPVRVIGFILGLFLGAVIWVLHQLGAGMVAALDFLFD